MHDHRAIRNGRSWIVLAALAGALSAPSFAAAESAPEEFRLTVYRGEHAVDEMRFADAAALERWLETRQARVRASAPSERDSKPFANPFLTDEMYLETDAEGRSIIP